jgi:hypothetical protein
MRCIAPIAYAFVLAGLAHAQPTITFRSSVELPAQATNLGLTGPALLPVTGMSGISRAPGGSYHIVQDGTSLTELIVDVNLTANASILTTNLVGARPLPGIGTDFEDLAFLPQGELLLVGEIAPQVYVRTASGLTSSLVTLPSVFFAPRPNLALESVTALRDGSALWTCNEEALLPDSPLSSPTSGSIVRLQRVDLTRSPGGTLLAQLPLTTQHCYLPEPWHGANITGARSGVVALVALPDDRLLVMERALAFGAPDFFVTRIYLVDPVGTGATNTLPLPSLNRAALGAVVPLSKALLYTGTHNNLEGLCLGPKLGPGRYALLAVTDDGGTADPFSTNRLLSFEISGVPCGRSDLAGPGQTDGPDGNLTADDLIVFINRFFASDPRADIARPGQAIGPDGAFTADDLIVFVNRFFAGC